jgi:hypothetical protein
VKNGGGNVYWPVYGVNHIVNMIPGEGYQLKAASPVVFYYSSNSAAFLKSVTLTSPVHYMQSLNTGNNMTLCIPDDAWFARPEYGDEIGITGTNGQLAGSAVYDGSNTIITIWGTDEYIDKSPGLTADEIFSLWLWDKINDKEVELFVEQWREGGNIYEPNGISVVGKLKTQEKSEYFSLMPNPAIDFTMLDFQFEKPGVVFITRELRTYSRKYVKLTQRQTSVLQEMERTLELCSIRITSFVSNISGKSVMNVIRQIIGGETNPEVLIEEIHGRIINNHGKQCIKESLTGFIEDHHRFMLELSLEEYDMLCNQAEKCLKEMEELWKKHYSKELGLLLTIPGINNISAMIILAETGADMKAFENSGKFSGWTGLRPRNDESAGKYKSTAATKGNRFLRTILVQVAWAAARTKGTYFKEKFTRLAMRKSRKKELVAIARKIGVIIWNVLYFKHAYNPDMLTVYEPGKVQAKMNYHQKELDRLEKLFQQSSVKVG